jgi:hypothetical protein
MKTNLKQKFLRTVLGGMGALMLLLAPSAFAFPTTGTCAMLVTQPVPYGASLPHSTGYNILATLTFTSATAGTVNYVGARATYATTGTTAGTPETGSWPFTIAAGPIAGSKTFSFTDTVYGSTVTANMYAVNGDKTILVQGSNDLFSGVCQF